MTRKILAVGNALVDIIARITPEDLADLGVAPGGMTLVDAQTSRGLYDRLRNAREISGGSAANTASIAASLGARTAYVGKTANDTLGAIFLHDLRSQGIEAILAIDDAPGAHTGSCLSLVTPDAQRTMCTHLGAAQTLLDSDVPANLADADIVFVEGYLLAFTLSDARCVARHLDFLRSIEGAIGLIFGNAEEMAALFPGHDGPHATADAAGQRIPAVVCTDGPNGAYIVENGTVTHLPARKVTVVDTTGAGDSLAGTVLWALASGQSLHQGTRLAMRVAAEVVGEIGARPSRDIAQMLRDEGLIA